MITFITGNIEKAKNFAQIYPHKVDSLSLDLPEIQSLDLEEVVKEKVRFAYKMLKKPVLVEDVSLEMEGLGRLPGTFIKFFLKELSLKELCGLAKGERNAKVKCILAYKDSETEKFILGEAGGKIAFEPQGTGGFGFDKIFIPDGFSNKTAAQLSEKEYQKYYRLLRKVDNL